MFFILSKLLYFLIQPLVWIIALGWWGIVAKHPRRRKRLWRMSIGMLIFFTNPFISSQVSQIWEGRGVSSTELPDSAAVGVVLGGFSDDSALSPDDGRMNLSVAANRLTDAIMLYRMGKIKRILIAGGNGNMMKKDITPEAETAQRYLRLLGIPDAHIWIENQSRNTHENAVFTQKLLQEKGLSDAPVVLITSAQHMTRAVACFRKIGLPVTPFATSYTGKKFHWSSDSIFIPDATLIQLWQMLFKEWVGIAAYKLQGYI